MSQTTSDVTKQSDGASSVPAWIASGILGLAVGAGGMYLGMNFIGPETPKSAVATKSTGGRPGPGEPGGGPAVPAMGGGGMGGGGMGMGGGGMGGGGMGGGGGGKRNLTSLVGKLELLSRADVKLHVELDAEQAKKVAAKLEELDKAEKMTAEEAQAHLDSLEALLKPEQKSTLDLIGLPFGRGGAGGGRGGLGAAGRPGAGTQPPPVAGAPPGGTVPPMAAMGAGGGPGGGSPDDNPFAQEANQKRLRDLLGRLSPESAARDSTEKTPESPAAEKPAAEKTDAEKPAAAKGAG
jgi:hypothetical protein